MSQSHLAACPFCWRHVRVSEPACPFCGRDLNNASCSVRGPQVPAVGRLSRAALFALGAGGVMATSACGSPSPPARADCDASGVECAPFADAAPDAAPSDATAANAEGSDGSLLGLAMYGCPPPPPGSDAECPLLRSSDAATDAADSGDASSAYASACPESTLPSCPVAGDASNCAGGCGLDSLPEGLACSGMSQCSMLVQPTPGCARTDGYVCSCVSGRWSCDDCWLGTALCEAGTGDP
jgi:hypothetical protein